MFSEKVRVSRLAPPLKSLSVSRFSEKKLKYPDWPPPKISKCQNGFQKKGQVSGLPPTPLKSLSTGRLAEVVMNLLCSVYTVKLF